MYTETYVNCISSYLEPHSLLHTTLFYVKHATSDIWTNDDTSSKAYKEV